MWRLVHDAMVAGLMLGGLIVIGGLSWASSGFIGLMVTSLAGFAAGWWGQPHLARIVRDAARQRP